MMSMRLCASNLEQFRHPVEAWEKEGYKVEVKACLSYCGDCTECPYLELDGELLMEDTMEALLEQLGKK